MQSKLNTLLWSFLACSVVLAQEVRIKDAIPFENGAKTSLAVSYTGSEKLTYFALDATKGVLTLDLPGVYSDVDFSQLQFAQVRAITQVPLNPDSNEGISISFFLRDHVLYSIYEGNAGELVIFFEDGPVAKDAVAATESAPAQETPAKNHVIAGEQGPGRLASVHVETIDQVGLIQLHTAANVETRDFYLSGPRRFVLDLKETICSLDQDLIELNAPLVKQVRIRQFQVDPSPVTRMVLDLETRTEVKVRANDAGLLVAFGPDEAAVDAVLTVGKLVIEEPVSDAVAEIEPKVAPPEVVAEDVVTAVEKAQPEALEADLVADVAKETIEQTTSEAPAEVAAEATPVVSTEAPVIIETAEATVPEQTVAKPSVEEVAIAEPAVREPVEQRVEVAESNPPAERKPEGVQTEAATVKELNQEPEAQEAPLVAVPQEQVAISEDETPLVQDQTVSQPDVAKEDSQVVADVEGSALSDEEKSLYESFQERSGNDENTVTLTLDVPHSDDLASIDAELEGFLDEDGEKTPYSMMRHANLKRPTRQGPIFMNNSTVENVNQKLAEMAPIQEDEVGTDPDDLESIFAEPEADDNFETLSGTRKQYRGFEIDSIDVKNVQVVDLLRFLASQINVNLYIDNSVSPNLTATYQFTNMPWDLALDMILNNANLDKEFSHGVLRVATVEKFRREAEQRRELQEQRELAVPVETVHIPLSYANAQDVEAIIRNYLSPRGLILRDDRTNTLIIEDIPKRMLSIRALIKKLDKMISQVTIEARVVETTKRFLRELGIQWGLSAQYSPELGTDTGMRFPNRVGVGGPSAGTTSPGGRLDGGYAVNFPVVDENPSGIGLSFGNFLDNFKLDISLQMLEDEGRGRIISAPKITTQNNKTATIQNGSRIPIQTIQRGTITIRYIDATLQLLVTPHITADETIIMDIVVDKSEPDFTRTVSGNPVINIRKADTRVLVKNGGTAVIGGIFTINEQNTNRGIPTLRNVPVIRRLFGNERVEYTNQELLIFVTPRIVKY